MLTLMPTATVEKLRQALRRVRRDTVSSIDQQFHLASELRNAAFSCNVSLVQNLLELGADATAIDSDSVDCSTSLHRAANSNVDHFASAKIAVLLLDTADGTLVNSEDSYLRTPLGLAATKSNLPLAKVLLEHGANPNNQDENGWTAVHRACLNGPLELVMLLIRFGGDIYIENKNGETALDWCDMGHVKLSSHHIERAFFYAPAQTWLRRESFAVFRSAIYGSPAFHARQKLLPEERRAEMSSIMAVVVVVVARTPEVWEKVDRVFGNAYLCQHIAQYL